MTSTSLPRGLQAQASAKISFNNSSRQAQNAQSAAEAFSSNADNITTGKINPDQLPLATATSPGIVQPDGTTILEDYTTGIITAATATSSSLGIVEPDNTTITISGGIISATGSGSPVGANPTATAGPTAINGVATTFLRSDGSPAVQLGSSSQKGLLQVDGTTITASSGVISATYPGSFSGFANPSASLGLTAVNGAATTAMRSDAAPALSQSISPTWSGNHSFSNPIKASAGSVSLPSLYFDSSPTTGFYQPGANQIAMAITGLAHWNWSTSSMSINHTSSQYSFILNAEGTATIRAGRYTTDASGPQFNSQKARGTIASPVTVVQNDVQFQMLGQAYGTTGFQSSTNILGRVIEPTPSDTAMGGQLTFLTSPLGSIALTEVARLESGTGLSMFGANPVIDQNRTHILVPSTVAGLPAVVTAGLRNVSDLEGGQGNVYGGTSNWRNIQNGQVATNSITGSGVLSKFTGFADSTYRGIINTTMQRLSSAGLLSGKLLGLWVHAVPTNQTDGLLNWITPGTRNAAIIGSPTWTANQGFTGDSTTGLIDSVASLTTFGATQNNVSVGTYVRTANTGSAKAVIGCNNVALARRTYLQNFTSGALVARCNDQTNDNYTPAKYTGMFVMTRSVSTGFNASVDDQAASTITRASVTQTSSIAFLGTADSTGSEFSNAQISFSFIGTTLTTTDIANLRAILVDYYLVQVGALSSNYLVSNLPLVTTVSAGTRYCVTDANATTFASTVAGGGTNFMPVLNNGTNWIIA